MPSVDLVFRTLQSGPPNDLVFGAEGSAVDMVFASVFATLPPPTLAAVVSYDNAVAGRMQSGAASAWQDATDTTAAVGFASRDAVALDSTLEAAWQDAEAVEQRAPFLLDSAIPSGGFAFGNWEDALPLSQGISGTFGDLARLAAQTRGEWQDADRLRGFVAGLWGDMLRRRAETVSRWSDARHVEKRTGEVEGNALRSGRSFFTRYQDAMPPPPGYWVGPLPPTPGERCYYPPFGNLVDLVFGEARSGTGDLLFVCLRNTSPATIIVPVRRCYIVLNTVHLFRASDDALIPNFALSLDLDWSSWTYGFSASLPASAMSLVEPAAFGEPVELRAEINGQSFMLLAEEISRDRQFSNSRISVSGRGQAAWLADPYAAQMSFANDSTRTAQQISNDILTINNVSLGWAVEFGLTDWEVPAGAFGFTGRYMEAVARVAEAGGGYVQPHPTAKTLRILPKYPVLPWALQSAAIDIELPSAVVDREGIKWVEKPEYNAVYVSGQAVGVLAQVKRIGSAGDKTAQTVVDPLITETAAARQRGGAILADTGRIATVSLSLPVLSATGIIHPGKIIRYMDGSVPRVGYSRSVQVQAQGVSMRQVIEVETHA